ncbi:DEAD/DEAH box helicase [Desulfopila aestuarii]|uniref:Superfamily II DNA or RNA helicase n=1 Tax=Desulfopila aestuarii DSM 18488 TaxID=1121416 RepID=A0A1M7Y7K2_9BACT|nr:DEAD/DEAH box helicase [Desulfopila aestuarii]SHO48599.1 Superfamily II DNA or RNA helicase [Desulfopila aestuarii DSM 18488]
MPTLTVTSDCLLSDIDFALEEELKKQLTIDNPQYLAAKKYGRWIGKKLKPTLKYYVPVPRGLRFPRGFSNQAIRICRELTGESPEIVDNRRLLPEVDFPFSGELRPYQQEAVELIEKRSFGVLEAGTGSGKTVMALAAIARRRQPTLVVVHTKELLYQWQERAATFLNSEVGLIGDGHFVIRPFTVAIVNTARKRVHELVPHFGHLIVDECHRVPAALFTDVVANFDCHYLLGLSATAFRSDDGLTRLIYYFMGDRIHKVDQGELQATGAIVKPQIIHQPTRFSYNYRGDYQALIKALTRHEGRNMQIVGDIINVVAEPDPGIALVVSDRVSHCELFTRLLAERGINVEMLTGQLSAEKRAEIVDAVREGRLQVLVATLQLISEGFDCPGLSTLFLTTPITFEGRLLQVIGRIMRPAANKQARVFDYVDEEVRALTRSANIRRKVLAGL